MKTAEIIVYERPGRAAPWLRDTDSVLVQVPYTKQSLRERLKAVGGRWDPAVKLWRVRFGLIRGDKELEGLIVKV